jgi:DNA-binding LacI/PurR family transcriptional regulator
MRIPQRASLLKQTTDVLRQSIKERAWTKVMPSERVLADQLQVSRPTVRAALKILQRERLIHISQGKPTHIVQRRRAAATPQRGVTLLTSAPLHAMGRSDLLVTHELRRHLQDAGYRLNIYYDARLRARDPHAVLEKLVTQLPNNVWVLLLQIEAVQRFFADAGEPTLVCGSTYTDVALPSFDVDLRAVSRHAVGEFLRNGHRRIALVTPKTGLAGDVVGERGFGEAFAVTPHADARALIIAHRQTVPSLCAAIEMAVKSASPPTGLLITHPKDVLTVLTCLHRLGLRVPQDMSIICRGHSELLDAIVPPLACYKVDWEAYARTFSRAVIQLAETGSLSRKTMLFEPPFCNGATLVSPPRPK